MTADDLPFWERPETVERFSGRDPDHRLLELIPAFPEPARTRVLDLGCAGGRNTTLLAVRGFDVIAIDASAAMVAETRRRLAGVLGEEEARARVLRGRMDRTGLEDASVHLVVALGVLHSAGSGAEWNRALAELRRVAAPGGRLLVANHTPECDPDGTGLTPGGEPHLFLRTSGPAWLLHAGELDAEMARYGFRPVVATETVRREKDDGGRRVTANALYAKDA